MHACPVREWRTGNDDGAENLRPNGRQHHDCPSGLAIADHARLFIGLRMQSNDPFEKDRLGPGNVLDGLSRHRLGQKSYEIASVAGLECDADLAVGLEAP